MDKFVFPEKIFLLGEGDDVVWCEDPAPGLDHIASEAVEYHMVKQATPCNNELLACPFCGNDDDLGAYPEPPFPEVICGNCGAHAPYDVWNTRP